MRMNPLIAAAAAASLLPCRAPAQGNVRETALARIAKAQALASDPALLKAVAAKNAARESMEEIKRKDREWMENPRHPLRAELSGSPCAQRLRELTKDDPIIVEAILIDAQGANVCVSRETSDYWQGDEPKFARTFGADRDVFVDEPAYDASSATYAIQLSVLVRDGKTKIGALTFSMRVRKEDAERPRPR